MMWRIRNFIKGIKNLIFFFPVVWKYQWWDYAYSLAIFKRSLEQYPERYKKDALETPESLNPKIEKMKRVIELLDIELKDDYIALAEKEMGFNYLDERPEGEHSKMHHRVIELEEECWNELWDIIKGSNTDGTSKFLKRLKDKEDDVDPLDFFGNGTDMRSWWD